MLSFAKNNLHFLKRQGIRYGEACNVKLYQNTSIYCNSFNKRLYTNLNMKEKSSCGIGIIVDMNRNSNRLLVQNANQIFWSSRF